MTIDSNPSVITQLTPNSINPVIPCILTFNVSGFSYPLVASDLSVALVSTANSSEILYINVVEVGNTPG